MAHTHSSFFRANRAALRRRQRGLSLIEFMVSITIGLILVAGLTLLFAQQSSTQAELEKSSRQIENGRFAMQLLRQDLQLAGYYGEFFNTGSLAIPGAIPDPCQSGAAELTAAMAFPVQGYDAPAGTMPASMATCALDPANHLAGTDILVVRHAEIDALATGLTVGQAYLQAGLTASKLELRQVLGISTSTTIDTTVFNLIRKDDTVAPVRPYSVHVYYVSPCSVPANGATCSVANTDDGGVSVPTLKRLELVAEAGVAKFRSVPLVEGIENMQIDFGFDSTADGTPDSYATDAAAVADWGDLMAVRIHLLARNNERSAGYKDDKTYNLGLAGATLATNDGFKRHVFSQTVRLVNPSARREN